MKKIVVNGGEAYGGLLTPKWIVEYNIVRSDCGFSEWIEEKHRIWS